MISCFEHSQRVPFCHTPQRHEDMSLHAVEHRAKTQLFSSQFSLPYSTPCLDQHNHSLSPCFAFGLSPQILLLQHIAHTIINLQVKSDSHNAHLRCDFDFFIIKKQYI